MSIDETYFKQPVSFRVYPSIWRDALGIDITFRKNDIYTDSYFEGLSIKIGKSCRLGLIGAKQTDGVPGNTIDLFRCEF